MSPPDSVQTSSDDEGSPQPARGRPLENLAELQAAIRNIERNRAGSPERATEAREDDHPDSVPRRAAPSHDHLAGRSMRDRMSSTPPLSREARKISHSRSSTESSIVLDMGAKTPSSAEDSDEPDGPLRRPIMVRKKSGELVKPALRPAAHRRPSSMPGTPTYAKAVHFDSHLEHVRHFLQIDRPVAVSAGSSPVEMLDAEMEFPFASDDAYAARASGFEWEIVPSNFPPDSPERRARPVWVERVFLSADKKNLIGSVAVANLAYHKAVVARFTLDYWKTTSEVMAEYNHDVRKRVHDGYDRFNFSIKLEDQAHLENKTLFFCVRYNSAGQEFWDNNDSMNFQVSFRKVPTQSSSTSTTTTTMPHGLGARPLNSMSRPRSAGAGPMSGRPWSMPSSFDDFGDGFDLKFDYGVFSRAGGKTGGDSSASKRGGHETSSPSSNAPLPDFPARRNNTATQAFGNRYDFGASLSAAIQAANTDSRKAAATSTARTTGSRSSLSTSASASSPSPTSALTSGLGIALGRAPGNPGYPRPESYISEKPSQQSPSYLELIDKYCFVRSGTPRIAEPT